MPFHLFVFLSVAYLSSTRYYQRALPLQKLGKLLGSQVTPLRLARSPKHHMAATAATHRVYCAQGKCWVLSSDFQRHEWCMWLQPGLLKVPFLLCNLCSWQMALVIILISGGCEMYLPETEAEQSSQTSAQTPTSTTERIFPCLYHPKSDDLMYDWQLETLPKKLLSVYFSSLPSSFPGPNRRCKTAS